MDLRYEKEKDEVGSMFGQRERRKSDTIMNLDRDVDNHVVLLGYTGSLDDFTEEVVDAVGRKAVEAA